MHLQDGNTEILAKTRHRNTREAALPRTIRTGKNRLRFKMPKNSYPIVLRNRDRGYKCEL